MNRVNIILIISIILILVGCSQIFKRKSNTNSTDSGSGKKPYMTLDAAKSVVDNLDKLGYYKYANATHLDTLKNDLISSLAEYGVLSTIYDEKNFIPFDNRLFLFDGETLFEEGGFMDAINSMKPLFNKLNLKFEITNHLEEWDSQNKWLNHRISINGTEYVIFKNFKDYGWGEAAQRFAEILNDQLKSQNINERLYLINGANDGQSIFLTNEEYDLINSTLNDDLWKPLKVEKWCKVFQVDPLKYKN